MVVEVLAGSVKRGAVAVVAIYLDFNVHCKLYRSPSLLRWIYTRIHRVRAFPHGVLTFNFSECVSIVLYVGRGFHSGDELLHVRTTALSLR